MTTPTIPCDKCGQPATKWFMQTSVALCDNHECLKYYEDAWIAVIEQDSTEDIEQ